MRHIRIHGRGDQRVGQLTRLLTAAIETSGRAVQSRQRWHGTGPNDVMEVTLEVESTLAEAAEKPPPAIVLVMDEALLSPPTPGLLKGVSTKTTLIIRSDLSGEQWQDRLTGPGRIISLSTPPAEGEAVDLVPVLCAAVASARLGRVSREHLTTAIRQELGQLDKVQLIGCVGRAMQAYDAARQRTARAPKASSDASIMVTP